MLLTSQQLKDLKTKLHEARKDQSLHCSEPLLVDGKPYRLEPKPHANEDRLKRAGHDIEYVGGVLSVRVPNGKHDADYLGINPETGEIVCLLCKGGA